jgi:excisionase family DNA binding protein
LRTQAITAKAREDGGGFLRPRPGGGPLLTAEQVGELLGVPKSWVYEQSRKGRIPTVTLGRYRRYRAEAIEKWIAELEEEGVGF